MYTATLRRQYRDAYTAAPKVLLSDITDYQGKPFRDHCWVKETPAISRLLAKYNKLTISFIGNEIIYLKRGKEEATTLQVVEIIRFK